MNNDFNTPLALTRLHALARQINKIIRRQRISRKLADNIVLTLRDLGAILGILAREVPIEEELPEEVERLLQQREEARKRKDWKSADRLRKEIRKLGYLLEDTDEGVRWRKIDA